MFIREQDKYQAKLPQIFLPFQGCSMCDLLDHNVPTSQNIKPLIMDMFISLPRVEFSYLYNMEGSNTFPPTGMLPKDIYFGN